MYRTKTACESRALEPDRKKFTRENDVFDNVHSAKAHIAEHFTPPAPVSRRARSSRCVAPPDEVAQFVLSKINSKPYKPSSDDLARVLRTVDYMLHNFRRALYVSIRDGKVAMFLCLRNRSGANPFAKFLKPVDDATKRNVLRHFQSHPDEMQVPVYTPVESWLVMNCVVANVFKRKPKEQQGYEMEHSHGEMKRLFATVCKTYAIPDCDFFVNYYDQIVLHNDLMVPFRTITDGRKVAMPHAQRYLTHGLSHILSTSSRAEYADVPFVFADDVQRIFKSYGIPKCRNPYVDEPLYELEWEKKTARAVFRGSSTGCGWTPETNQRLAVMYMSTTKWARDPRYRDLFDVALTGRELVRFKKNVGEPVRFYVDPRVQQTPEKALTMAEQSRFKYVLYIEGNVVAYRLTAMFGMGSVVVYVKGEYQPWFYKLLRHRHNCIMVGHVNALPEAIAWCVRNDDACKAIAQRGLEMYHKHFSKRGIMGYVAWTLRQVAATRET